MLQALAHAGQVRDWEPATSGHYCSSFNAARAECVYAQTHPPPCLMANVYGPPSLPLLCRHQAASFHRASLHHSCRLKKAVLRALATHAAWVAHTRQEQAARAGNDRARSASAALTFSCSTHRRTADRLFGAQGCRLLSGCLLSWRSLADRSRTLIINRSWADHRWLKLLLLAWSR